jgi:hypothetical protein
VRSISQQGSPARLLVDLVQRVGELPAAYITMHTPFEDLPVSLNLQLDTPHAFEAWRAALDLPSDNVGLHSTSGLKWVEVRGRYQDVPVILSGVNVPLTDVQITAPRDRSAVTA